MFRDPAFKPEKEYSLPSTLVTPANATGLL